MTLRKKQKTPIVLALMCLLAVFLPFAAHADTGPKPSVTVTFSDLPAGACYATLLSEKSSTGPFWAWDGERERRELYDVDEEIGEAFYSYEDPDGYFFLQTVWRVDVTGELCWGYYPPQTFKILLYFPESGTYAVSGVYERYAFHSYYTVSAGGRELSAVPDGSGDAEPVELTAQRTFPYGREIAGLAVRAAITVALEIGVALLFGIRGKRALWWLFGINLATQAALNVAIYLVSYHAGGLLATFALVPAELAVFAAEAILYAVLLPPRCSAPHRKRFFVLYALVANAVSLAAGLLLGNLWPQFF